MEIERLVELAAQGFAKGLLKALMPEASAPGTRTQPRARKPAKRAPRKPRNRQLPLSPELEKQLRQSFVPPDPRSPMDDYESAVPSAEQLDDLFAGADPENEAIAALRRQMTAQREAAARTAPPKPEPDVKPEATWNQVPG